MPGRFDKLHGRLTGRGSFTVVLGHGFGTDQTAWSGVRDWLDDHCRVVSFDFAGAGPDGEANYDPRRHTSIFGHADDLLDILGELKLGTCIYIGHSVGCMIGAAAAAGRAALFERLLFVGGSPRYLNDGDYHGGFEQPDLDGLYDGMAANFQAWAAGFVPLVVGVPDRAAISEFSRTLFLMRPDIALATARMIFQSDMRSVVRGLRNRAHIIQARRDIAVPPAVAGWLHAHIDGSTLDIVDAEGHLPHMTAPDRLIPLFERYLMPVGVG
ncbi:alpha/beta fold hydrolase [Labrys monachus]|uniref:Sigma-B regulation protein RsbQ n=1 Tax=Labrys monachus TaxID=217067 RepID=A0ABU0FQV0_9HYPH|nr:alpha/beta hydrolase [Labrys monachus]MDQ0396435.1 sigma-B regulation protein RsbQ [Labrys monachus]